MEINKTYRESVLTSLPSSSDIKYNPADKVKVKVGNRIQSYIMDSNRQWLLSLGVTIEQNGVLEELSLVLVNKLRDDYTRNQINDLLTNLNNSLQNEIDQAIVQQDSQIVQITSTSLPQGEVTPSLPDKGVAFLIGAPGGSTYTQTGSTPITVQEGYLRLAYYWKTTNVWTAGLSTPLPQPITTGRVVEGNTNATNGGQVFIDIFGSGNTDLNNLILNRGKRYPFVNYANETVSTIIRFKNAILGASLKCIDDTQYNYTVSLLSKNSTTSGNRIDITKKNKTTNATISTEQFRTIGSLSPLSTDNINNLNKLSQSGIQTIIITARDFSYQLELIVDTSAFNATDSITLNTADFQNFVFVNSVYKKFEGNEINILKSRMPFAFVDSGITLTENGKLISRTDGSLVDSGSAAATQILNIDFTKEFYVSGQMLANSATLVAYYDSSNNFLGTQFPSSGTSVNYIREQLIYPAGAIKFAFSSYGTGFKLENKVEDLSIGSVQYNETVLDLNNTKAQVVTLQNNINTLNQRVTQLELNPSYKIVKAVQYENQINSRETYLRQLLRDKIIANPSYVAPYYGIEWNENHVNPNQVVRKGVIALHASLPIQNKIRRCIVKEGVFQYYLNANDSYLREDGITSADLTGASGDVMVEIPEFFYKMEEVGTDGSVKSLYISEEGISDYKFSPKHYLSAYECTVDRDLNKLASVCTTIFSEETKEIFIENASRYVVANNSGYSLGVKNVLSINSYIPTATRYRGVTNLSSLDSETNVSSQNYSRNQLGRPVSAINRKTSRLYADNAGGVIQQYNSQRAIYFLAFIEYSTRNIQVPVTNVKTVEGYTTGGLGFGATRYPDYASYEKYFSPQGGNAFLPNGLTNKLGNNSGEVVFLLKNVPINSTGTGADAIYTQWGDVYVTVNSYRGIENFYGHLYKIVDNIDSRITNLGGGIRRNEYYYQSNPYLTNDSDNKQGYTKIGDYSFNSSIRVVKNLMWGENAHILPINEGGEGTPAYSTYYADCVEHVTGWNGNTGEFKYLTYNGRAVSALLVGFLFSVIVIDMASDRFRTSDTVRLQYF